MRIRNLFSFIITIGLFASCANNSTETQKENTEQQLEVKAFADSLKALPQDPSSFDGAAVLFNKVEEGENADSALVILLKFTGVVIDSANERLYRLGEEYCNLLNEGNETLKPTKEQQEFATTMKGHHLRLQSNGEGGCYQELNYQWLQSKVNNKLSPAGKVYLSYKGNEAGQPAVMDAGFVIPVSEIAQRSLTADSISKLKLPKTFHNDIVDAKRTYEFFTITGVDNTPSVDYEQPVLDGEFKKVYDEILKKYPSSSLAEKIRDWLKVVASKNREQIDAYKASISIY
jgi:hypothetical protein